MVRENTEALELASKLISINSVTGGEEDIISFLSSYLEEKGFSVMRLPSGSIAASYDYKRKGPVLVLDGHIDTVDVKNEDEWVTPPFNATVRDGWLRGRGASDMEGAVASFITAASSLLDEDLSGRLVISCTVEEERFEGIAARDVTSIFHPDYTIIGESTGLRLNIGQRGRAEIRVRADGVSCHSSNPEAGKNAIYAAMDAIARINTIEAPLHPVLGKGVLVPVDIISSPYPGASVIPDKVTVTYDRRTLPGETPESVVAQIQDALDGSAYASLVHGSTVSYSGAKLEADRFFPSWLMDENDEIVVKARNALENANLFHGIGAYSFCTNGSHYRGEAGIATIGYGPGEERYAHTANEGITLESLYESVLGYRAIIKELLS